MRTRENSFLNFKFLFSLSYQRSQTGIERESDKFFGAAKQTFCFCSSELMDARSKTVASYTTAVLSSTLFKGGERDEGNEREGEKKKREGVNERERG